MKVDKITQTNESAFGKSIIISPIMIPNMKIQRVSPEGKTFEIIFLKEDVEEVFNQYVEDNSREGHVLLIDGLEFGNYPEGTWIYVEETDKGYMIEAVIKDIDKFKITE